MRTGNAVAICSVERLEHTRLSVANQATHPFYCALHVLCSKSCHPIRMEVVGAA